MSRRGGKKPKEDDVAGPVLELRNLHKEIPCKDREPFAIFKNINL